MKSIVRNMCTVLAVLGILSAPALAQPGMRWHGSGGWGPGAPYGRMYDPATVETVSGEVVGIQRFVPEKGMQAGVHLQLKTEKETLDVHLGPAWYVENQDVKIALKDQLQIKGSKVSFSGKPTLLAAEVVKGNETLVLRDQNGVPVWSGWRMR